MDLRRLLTNQWDRTAAVGLGILGLLAAYLGYRGVADGIVPSQQIPYLASGAVVGIYLLGVGATVWLSADLRDEWRILDEMASSLDELVEIERRRDATVAAPGASTADSGPSGHASGNGRSTRSRPLTTGGRDGAGRD